MDQHKLRALKALDAHRNGLKLRQIGDALGVTRERARQLIIVGKKIERNLLSHDLKHELSTRIRNALSDDGCELIPDAVANHFKSLGQLRRIPNLGKKSIDELQIWLQRHGKKPICE